MTDRVLFWSVRYGPAAVIAVLLVFWLTHSFAAQLESQGTELRALGSTLSLHSSETAYFLRAICINAADHDAQKLANCELPPERR